MSLETTLMENLKKYAVDRVTAKRVTDLLGFQIQHVGTKLICEPDHKLILSIKAASAMIRGNMRIELANGHLNKLTGTLSSQAERQSGLWPFVRVETGSQGFIEPGFMHNEKECAMKVSAKFNNRSGGGISAEVKSETIGSLQIDVLEDRRAKIMSSMKLTDKLSMGYGVARDVVSGQVGWKDDDFSVNVTVDSRKEWGVRMAYKKINLQIGGKGSQYKGFSVEI